MPQSALTRRSIDYEKIIADIESLAEMLRNRPELNHHAAERLSAIAAEMKRDAELLKNPHARGEAERDA